MPPGKSVSFPPLYYIAQVRATSNILLIKHYNQLTQVLNTAPKVSLVVNAIKLAF
ncbi:hypothetical protein M595_2988 [Lyngbya aestuarii BL J]|uniref:Uncharacterized protein n=1 Tax=Lyngbya aestuarii BL J TaxID=1348334 RepID=U7QGU1_9CYAN|nr:hypothetical protein [Lyngbya aestuarii]ERT07108.1 hypothetical protein M595_2988 [Lyngbya aestuarii BL J]